jgi:hypothetical protein
MQVGKWGRRPHQKMDKTLVSLYHNNLWLGLGFTKRGKDTLALDPAKYISNPAELHRLHQSAIMRSLQYPFIVRDPNNSVPLGSISRVPIISKTRGRQGYWQSLQSATQSSKCLFRICLYSMAEHPFVAGSRYMSAIDYHQLCILHLMRNPLINYRQRVCQIKTLPLLHISSVGQPTCPTHPPPLLQTSSLSVLHHPLTTQWKTRPKGHRLVSSW